MNSDANTKPNSINRNGGRKRKLRNLLKRGRIWYWKRMAAGHVQPVSLKTDNEALAIAKRDELERQMVSGELARMREGKQAATLAQIFAARDAIGGITQKSIYCSKRAMLNLVWLGTGDATLKAEDISLALLTPKLLRDYQDRFRAKYETAAGDDEKARRAARNTADRSSKSLVRQARSLFSKEQQLISRYKEQGLVIPESLNEFLAAQAVGKMSTKVYHPPSDAALAATFADIETLRTTAPDMFDLFWAVVAIGGRRNEVLDFRVEDLEVVNGNLWVNGGHGKDGEVIRLPVISWPVHPSSTTIPADVLKAKVSGLKSQVGTSYLFGENRNERQDKLPRRLNAWLAAHGWHDEKKLHGLRAYVGSILYAQNPRLAQQYLRHKSLSTTETFYTHFLELGKVTQLRMVEAPAATAVEA